MFFGIEGAPTNCNEQRHAAHSEVAVPKNIQRNLISRERDGRKMGPAAAASVGNPVNNDRKNKPRSMQAVPVAAAPIASVAAATPASANPPEEPAADEAPFVS